MQIPPSLELPDKFDLVVTSEYLFYPALKKWRNGYMIGIEFAGEPYRPSVLIGDTKEQHAASNIDFA